MDGPQLQLFILCTVLALKVLIITKGIKQDQLDEDDSVLYTRVQILSCGGTISTHMLHMPGFRL